MSNSKLTYPAQFVVQQNHSMSWRGNKLFLLSLAVLSFGIAAIFAYMGLWLILPFAGLEILALTFGLYYCSLRCKDREVITVTNDSLLIERGRDKPKERWQFQRAWTHLELKQALQPSHTSQLLVRSKGEELEIARYLTNKDKKTLADSLTVALNNSHIFS